MEVFYHILVQIRKEVYMNKKIISLILGIMCVLLSYGIAVQIKTVNGTETPTSGLTQV